MLTCLLTSLTCLSSRLSSSHQGCERKMQGRLHQSPHSKLLQKPPVSSSPQGYWKTMGTISLSREERERKEVSLSNEKHPVSPLPSLCLLSSLSPLPSHWVLPPMTQKSFPSSAIMEDLAIPKMHLEERGGFWRSLSKEAQVSPRFLHLSLPHISLNINTHPRRQGKGSVAEQTRKENKGRRGRGCLIKVCYLVKYV